MIIGIVTAAKTATIAINVALFCVTPSHRAKTLPIDEAGHYPGYALSSMS